MQDSFTVVGYSKSGMSEYDSTHVYVPIARLQWLRGIGDGQGNGAVTHIQIKARAGVDLDELAADVQAELERIRPMYFRVSTWEQKQGPLLAAVAVEQSILNMLLFFIIAVAGFGILATFSMIVVEKTRDIGVLKALGASSAGVRGIFLGYGLSLGIVGSGVGMLGGLRFVHNINDIEKWLSQVTGRKVFDDAIYYFNEIPTRVEPATVAWIVVGALFIAVGASVWPAQRALEAPPGAGPAVRVSPRVYPRAEGSDPMASQLSAMGVAKSYRKGKAQVPVLHGVDLEVERGRIRGDRRRERVGQEHAAARPRPARRPRRRRRPARRQADRQPARAQARRAAQPDVRVHLPVLPPAARTLGPRERPDAADDPARGPVVPGQQARPCGPRRRRSWSASAWGTG